MRIGWRELILIVGLRIIRSFHIFINLISMFHINLHIMKKECWTKYSSMIRKEIRTNKMGLNSVSTKIINLLFVLRVKLTQNPKEFKPTKKMCFQFWLLKMTHAKENSGRWDRSRKEAILVLVQ